MTNQEVVQRARSALGRNVVYELGRGGFHPTAESPADVKHRCDCSGFAAWCLGVSRNTDNPWYKAFNGGWLETTAIMRDAMESALGMFAPAPIALPGMLIVWGDRDGHQGHVGVISEVANGAAWRVIHCSLGNYRTHGDAIQETDPSLFFHNRAINARCAWVEYGA